MKKIKSFAGYINLKPINGVLYPSSIQNIIMKDYITNSLNSKFYLSPTEVLQAKHSITLNTLISDEVKVNGIVMLSTFSLPIDYSERKDIFYKSIKKKKELHFILDEIVLVNKKNIEKIEDQLIFRNSFFTKTKTKLEKNEKKIFSKFKTSFV